MIKGNRFKKFVLLLGDIALLYGALFLTLVIRYGSLPSQRLWQEHRTAFLFVNIIWIIMFYIVGLYDFEKFARSARITLIGRTMLVGWGLAIAIFYFVPFSYFGITPKTNLLIYAIFVSLFIWLWRTLYHRIITKGAKIKVFFLGSSAEISYLSDFIDQNPQLGYKTIKDINEAALIVISEQTKQNPEFVKSLYDMVLKGKTIVDFYHFYEQITGKVPVPTISKTWFLENMVEINKRKFEQTKRLADLFVAGIISVPFALFFPFVAAAIKLTSKGPVFFKQKRVGKNGKIFNIYKFRSMLSLSKDGSAETEGAKWAQKNDARVTSIGNFLRKTRLDEWPQVINVFKGDISFVGPRPERPEFVEDLAQKVPYYSIRHLVKPGVSGWAQINYDYGSSVEDALQKLHYDLYYIKNRSIILEISIMLKTIMTILQSKGR
ncbi:sugar transferase [Candidatus Parcubacteria bacterium]|nr:MAG: sugar transferase [Candidatus Parcubacteria bacterium]